MKKFRYKANLHCHTTVSDGTQTPEQIKELYTAQGYHIVAFTDHETLTPQNHLSDENFLALTAMEVGINQGGDIPWHRRKCYHFNLYAPRQTMDAPPLLLRGTAAYNEIDAINRYIAERNAEGYLVCYNHPYWSLQNYSDYAPLRGLWGMEIYNHGCEVTDGYYGYNPQAYDEMLRVQPNVPLFCLATDDNHNNHDAGDPAYGSFGGWVWVDSPSLSYADVMAALKNGNFYATTGPEIHDYALNNNTLTLRCDPCELIIVHTQDRRCRIKKGPGLTEATFTLKGDEGYVRITCRDADKKDAVTNAMWLSPSKP
jgi:hypothetical protein